MNACVDSRFDRRARVAAAPRRALVALLVLFMAALAFAVPARATDVPFLSGRVVDAAEVLKPATRAALTDKLKAFEQQTGNQVVVLTLPTLGGDGIEDFSTRAFEAYKLGQKGKDNGVLIVVAAKDRKLRIEVGYGVEGKLTDVAASRIIRNVMTPAFRNGDFDGGITQGVDAVLGVLGGTSDGKAFADVDSDSASSGGSGFPMSISDPSLPPWPMRILLGCFIFGIIGVFTFVGIATPRAGWFLYFFLIPFWAMFPIVILGAKLTLWVLGTYLVGFPLAKLLLSRTDWYARNQAAGTLPTVRGAGFGGRSSRGQSSSSAGSWTSSSSSSSSSDSGGFSGGGGSSGGGGASGSW